MLVNPAEIAKFAPHAARWWDIQGPFGVLHRMNPARLAVVRECLGPLRGLTILDVGCGGGLTTEALARKGAIVTGLDASPEAISVAKAHAQESGLSITYTSTPLEEMTGTFDAVLTLEVIEHITDKAAFIAACAARVKDGGRLIISSMNRTPASFALGIIAAEYILRWVPRGTHDWFSFPRPCELAAYGREVGLETQHVCGLVFNPLTQGFMVSQHKTAINYMMCLRRNSYACG